MSAVGYQIESLSGGAFVAHLEAFDGANSDLGFVTESGSDHGPSNNNAIFIGGTRPTPDIKSIVISLDAANGDPTAFAINRTDFRTTSSPAAPEPGSLALLVGLVAGGAAFALHRRRTRA